MLAPGKAAAETDGEEEVGVRGGKEMGCMGDGGCVAEPEDEEENMTEGGPAAGVGGKEGEGEGGVVTHILEVGVRREGGK